MVRRYIPGRERERPYYLELVLQLPARSVTEFSIELDYLFLKWQEYPPDANHGFYMGPAIITSLLPTARNYTALPQDGSTISSTLVLTRTFCQNFILIRLINFSDSTLRETDTWSSSELRFYSSVFPHRISVCLTTLFV